MAVESTTKDLLLAKIEDRSAVVGVIGLGYVGLPLAVEFAKAGFRVIGYDVSERVVALLMRGESHIQDVAAADVAALVKSGKFEATTDKASLGETDAISIAVPTPLCKTRDPDMSYVISAAETATRQARKGTLVVLESTTYPGTTREILMPALEARGFMVGEDVFVAFSPERVDPGNPVYHTKNTPKVVGGITPNCTELAMALYTSCIDTMVRVSSPEAAELTKLLENTFRSVNIGLVNEMAIVCDKLGVDVWEVIEAAATKPFGFMKFTPGPGIGGHCIPLDPHYLAWKMRTLNYKTRFIDLASEINSQMPAFVVEKVSHALNMRPQAGQRQPHPRARRRLQARHRRRARESGARRDPPARGARRGRRVPRSVHRQRAGGRPRPHGRRPHEGTCRGGGRRRHRHRPPRVDYQMVVDNASLIVDTRNVTASLAPSKARVVSLAARSNAPAAEGALT